MKTINLFLLVIISFATINCKKTETTPDYANLISGREYIIQNAGVGGVSSNKSDFTISVSKVEENLVLLKITRRGTIIVNTKCKIMQEGDWYVINKTYTPNPNDIRWSTFISYSFTDGRKYNEFRFDGFDDYLNKIGITAAYFGQ